MAELLARLQAALAGRYRIEREIGHGGMAVVYLADDLKHHRPVALKVLKPELASALGPERFLREIELSAGLAHPHILPLYDSGEADGFLYYVMPYVDGESLRDRLQRERQLPIEDALQVAREVADALSHAHSHGVIHRDIKPENILFEAGHAVVADFGIARAVSAAGGATLTETGLAVGTPAYMSPEQAAGERTLDGRSDLYALGCVLYEALTGQPPFTGPTVESLVHQHLAAAPPHVTAIRPSVPAEVAAALERSLAKTPADRFRTAGDLAAALAAAAPAPTAARAARVPAVGMLAGAAVGVLALTRVLVLLLGLPDWLWEGALALVGVGVAAFLVGEWWMSRRQRACLTPRRALAVTGAALLVIVLSGAGYLSSRRLGVGPFATPISRGELGEQVRVVLADFLPVGVDTSDADAVTELLRIDLQQSPVIHTLARADVQSALARMRREPGRLDAETAQQVARREGAAAVLGGELRLVRGQYLLLAGLTSAADSAVLVSERETARDSTDLIAAAERLSRRLRERIGESLRDVRASDPLPKVTTASLRALTAFAEGQRAEYDLGERARAIRLLEEAVAIDTAFAMAYTTLSVIQGNAGNAQASRAAAEQAYRFRDRLSERERVVVEWNYHSGRNDLVAQEDALHRWVALAPASKSALNNFSVLRLRQRRFAEAETLALRAVDAPGAVDFPAYWNALEAQVAQRRFAAADSLLARWPPELEERRWSYERYVAWARKDFAVVEAVLRRRLAAVTSRQDSAFPLYIQSVLELVHGRIAAGDALWRPSWSFARALDWATYHLAYAADTAGAEAILEEALRRRGWDTLPPAARRYHRLVPLVARLGRPADARRLLDEWSRSASEDPYWSTDRWEGLGWIALAEGRPDSAIAAFRAWSAAGFADFYSVYNRGLVEVGMVYDRLGVGDSAVALFERALAIPFLAGYEYDVTWYPHVLRRLGELHASLGHRDQAIDYYGQFIDLWQDADPALQPLVEEARAALVRLTAEPHAP